MKKAFFLVPVALLFLAVSCPPEKPITPRPDQLPPITQTGANTFGCLINGKVWLPRLDHPDGSNILEAQYYQGLFMLYAIRSSSTTDFSGKISWAHKYIDDTGTYYFKTAPANGGPSGALYYRGKTMNNYYTSDSDSLNNYVKISKLDQVNEIISGTFNLHFTKTGFDTIKITQGRFDLKYTY